MPDQQSTQLLLDQDLQPQKVLSTAATTVNNTLSKQSQELASIIQAEHLAGCDPQFGPCETLSLESLEMETKAVLECDPRLSRGSNHSISILNRVIGEFQSSASRNPPLLQFLRISS